MTNVAVEAAGWAGAAAVLAAYALVSSRRLRPDTVLFQALNIAGAAGMIVNGWWHGALPSVTLNIIWIMIGAAALWRIRRERRARA